MRTDLPAISPNDLRVGRRRGGPSAAEGIWIGHYGCASRLVKVGCDTPDGQKRARYTMPKRTHRVKCPACGYEHRVKVMWRIPKDRGEFSLAEVIV